MEISLNNVHCATAKWNKFNSPITVHIYKNPENHQF